MINVKQKTITPQIAEEILRKNTNKRTVKVSHVKWLASMMSDGKWKMNGDTICVNSDVLIDGQHRLMAVVKSGVTIECLVVEGLESHVFDTKDSCSRRSASDTLHMAGVENPIRVASALKVVDELTSVFSCSRLNHHFSNQDAEELLKLHPGIIESVRLNSKSKYVAASILAGCHYVFSKKSRDQADFFVGSLMSGIELDAASPIYALRERLINNKHRNSKLERRFVLMLIIKAWNAFRSGKSSRSVIIPPDGVAKLPEII